MLIVIYHLKEQFYFDLQYEGEDENVDVDGLDEEVVPVAHANIV